MELRTVIDNSYWSLSEETTRLIRSMRQEGVALKQPKTRRSQFKVPKLEDGGEELGQTSNDAAHLLSQEWALGLE